MTENRPDINTPESERLIGLIADEDRIKYMRNVETELEKSVPFGSSVTGYSYCGIFVMSCFRVNEDPVYSVV